MRKTARLVFLFLVTLLSAVALAVSAMVTSAGFSLAATTTALIMGGTGRPDPQDFPGYMENVESYYIVPNTTCGRPAEVCNPVSVFTPETAWPLYGGLDALTWGDSILQGVEDLDGVVQPRLGGLSADNRLVIFGYSQSGAIVAFEKAALASQLTPAQQALIEWVVIGNVSRANGGLNGRANGVSIPIVDFPFGPSVPTNTGMLTTDIAMKWDIIADAPVVITNPIAMLNALLGFEYVHGTYPDPTQASPDSTPGGYTQAQWQAIMDAPEEYAALNPDLVNVQTFGDTKFITVTPTVLPIVAPLHQIGLKPLADLIEPALRAFIEHTGYRRDIPYGQPTPFQLIPIFNPIALAIDLVLAVPRGITNMINGLQGKPTYPLIDPPSTLDESASTLSTLQSGEDQLLSGSMQRTQNMVQTNEITVEKDVSEVDASTELTANDTTETADTNEPEETAETEDTTEPEETVESEETNESEDAKESEETTTTKPENNETANNETQNNETANKDDEKKDDDKKDDVKKDDARRTTPRRTTPRRTTQEGRRQEGRRKKDDSKDADTEKAAA